MEGVYLIHFARPYRHARHYMGYAKDISDRVNRHFSGQGSHLMRVVRSAEIPWVVVRIWPNKRRRFERRLKFASSTGYCPICNPETWHRRGLFDLKASAVGRTVNPNRGANGRFVCPGT